MSWTECINPFKNPVKHLFFRHTTLDKRYNRGDTAKICPICWFKALIKAHPPNGVPGPLKKLDCKPEKDTL